MSRNRLAGLALLVCPLVPPAAEAATVQHFEPLRFYRVDGARETGAQKPAVAAPTTVSFNAFSRDFALDLEPNARLAAMQLERAPGTAAYRGTVAGRPDSWVRLVLTPAGPSGIVFDGETLYGIEADGTGVDAAATGPVMFRLADVYFAPGELGCEGGVAAMDGVQAIAALQHEIAFAAGAALNLNLGAVADFEFSQAFGGSASSALMTRLNNVDGIYSQQLGVQITVAQTDIFATSDDPFTATTVAGDLLNELAIYRGATPSQDAQGLTHLFTGRNLDGTTVGVAYTGAVCATRSPFDVTGRSFGAGLSQSGNSVLIDTLVAAHEIGHNFGAPHDGQNACASTPPTGFIMAPSVNPAATQFSACSIQEMQAEIAGASCLTPLGPANMAVTLPQVPQMQGGVSSTHTVTMANRGADEATGVSFAATAEAPLTIVAADAGASSCTVAAQSASCTFGTVGSGASRTVALTLRSASAGTFALTATVDADSDANAADDSRSVAVTVVPAVDLVWSGSSSGVQLNAQTTLTAVLDNASDFAASNVAVTASLSAGLRPDGASLSGTACTIASQAITCPARSVAARTNVALVVAATGTAVGPEQMTLSVTATEAERAPANNQLSMAVTVSAPPADDGGGGALSWWAVLALLAARGIRSRLKLGRRRPS